MLICSTIAGSLISTAEKRSTLYAKMAKDLDENGAVFLKGGETSQSLSLSDIFTLKDGTVTPVLKVNTEVESHITILCLVAAVYSSNWL